MHGSKVKRDDPAVPATGPVQRTIERQDRSRVASLWSGATRALLVVFGGLLILQSSDRLDAPKLGYLFVAGIATAGSVAAVVRARSEPMTNALRPWFAASAVIIGLVALSLPVALVNGATIGNWLRDAAAYVLLAAAPWIAVDLARSASPRLILRAGLLAGLLGVASFVVVWVQRRQLIDLPIDRLTLPSMTLGAAAYCIAIGLAVRSRGWERAGWIVISMAVLAAFLLTGTRTSFVLLAAPAAVVLFDVWQRGRVGLRAGALPGVAQIAAVALVLFVSFGGVPAGPTDVANPSIDPGGPTGSSLPSTGATPAPRDLEDRFSTLDDITSGRDQSLQLRLEVTRIAWQTFLQAPLLGTGLGHEFSFMETPIREYRGLTLDTPVVVLAKFGILGLLLSGVLTAAFFRVIRGMIRSGETGWPALTLVGYGAVLLALVPLGWPPEDKGTAFALVFLLALAAIERSQSAETAV